MFLDERFTHRCSLIKISLIRSQTDPFRKHSTSFGERKFAVRKFVCILSVLCTVSVLILRGKDFSSSALIPCHVLISQNVAHVLESKRRAWVLRTWLQFAAERKRKKSEAGISTLAFSLESPCNYSSGATCTGHVACFRGWLAITLFLSNAARLWGRRLFTFFLKCGAYFGVVLTMQYFITENDCFICFKTHGNWWTKPSGFFCFRVLRMLFPTYSALSRKVLVKFLS